MSIMNIDKKGITLPGDSSLMQEQLDSGGVLKLVDGSGEMEVRVKLGTVVILYEDFEEAEMDPHWDVCIILNNKRVLRLVTDSDPPEKN
jgi:hypothetical protein